MTSLTAAHDLAICCALEAAGVEFIDENGGRPGVRLRNALLVSAGMTMENVIAQTTASELDKIERFNRLIANAEGRRNALLREIERHRAPLAQRLRAEIHKIEDAEFETIEANAVAPTCNSIAA